MSSVAPGLDSPRLLDVGALVSEGFCASAVVYGPPASMGSKRAFRAKSGKLLVVDAKAKNLRSFQSEMRDSMRETAPTSVLLGPVEVTLEIVMHRPKGHFGTGKNAALLKGNSPHWCTTKPDADKVLRAVADCGTGIWWRDDAQMAIVSVKKRYAAVDEEQRVICSVRAMDEDREGKLDG